MLECNTLETAKVLRPQAAACRKGSFRERESFSCQVARYVHIDGTTYEGEWLWLAHETSGSSQPAGRKCKNRRNVQTGDTRGFSQPAFRTLGGTPMRRVVEGLRPGRTGHAMRASSCMGASMAPGQAKMQGSAWLALDN